MTVLSEIHTSFSSLLPSNIKQRIPQNDRAVSPRQPEASGKRTHWIRRCQEDVGPHERNNTDHVNRSSVKIIALDSKINGNQYPLTIYYPVPSPLKKMVSSAAFQTETTDSEAAPRPR